MSTPEGPRSVKIGSQERGAWSSDRPRRESAAPRPPDVSVRGRVLSPTERLRYDPGSLVVLVSAAPAERDRFADRVFEDRSALLSVAKVRGLLAGRVPDEEVEERTGQLLEAAALKRLRANETVILAADGLESAAWERFVVMAARAHRPRHLILLETSRDNVAEEDRPVLNELRRSIDAGELGAAGFHTALRLGGAAISEVRRITFRPAPREDD